jgi:DUF4097 and DUF4098 domain-containing protein YvlB
VRIHSVTLAVLGTMAIALAARAGDLPPTLMDRSEKAADVRGLAGLDVDNARGRVEIRPSTDGRLHVVATRIFRMGDAAAARRYAEQTSVQSGPRGARYVVDVRYPHRIETGFSFFDLFSEHGRRRFRLPSIEVVLELQVPPGLPVRVTTASGDVNAGSLEAPIGVTVASGDVVLSAMRGDVTVQSASGDVALEQVAAARVRTMSGDLTAVGVGALDCVTMSGDIEVKGARDSLVLGSQSGDVAVDDAPAGIRAHSTSGEVNVRGACGRVLLETTSGEVRARLRGPLKSAELASTSGGVGAELVSGVGARLTVVTTSGSIDCSVPMTVSRHDRNRLEATIGQGGPPIHMRTVSGNLTVTSGGK